MTNWQKWLVIISIIGLMVNTYFDYRASQKQVIIKQEWDKFKSDSGEFKTIHIADDIKVGEANIYWNGSNLVIKG